MYGKGMSQRDIAATVKDIYGFNANKDLVSKITDKIWDDVQAWRNRPLQSCYPFVFVDCLYVSMKRDGITKKHAVYVMLAYTLYGKRDIFGIWNDINESTHTWMNTMYEIRERGVNDIFFISMDGLPGLEKGTKAIFPDTITQRCIVHLIRNSFRFVPSKDYKQFANDLKAIYASSNLEQATYGFEQFKNKWSKYPGAIRIWEQNFNHIEQLDDYPQAIRKIMYTTNSIEAVNSSFRKVLKKGSLESEKSLYKLLYLRTKELNKKWEEIKIRNWSQTLNQLLVHEEFSTRIEKYLNI